MGMLDAMPMPGQIGLTTRPKPRALDKILSSQRDKEQSQVQNAVAPMLGNPMGGGLGGLTRPDTLAMLLGAGR